MNCIRGHRRGSQIFGSGSALSLILTIITSSPAYALLTRYDYYHNANFSRYIELAQQSRFDTVGAVVNSAGGACSGSLISASVVLTAAHCFFSGSGATPVFATAGPPTSTSLVGTFTSGVSAAFIGGPTLRDSNGNFIPQYAGYADSVAIFSGYNNAITNIGSSANSGDIALVHIASLTGVVPSNYLPVNTSGGEDSAKIAVTLGYGHLGNGVEGDIDPNATLMKLAGATTVSLDPGLNNVVKSTFLNPKDFPALGLPADFLQAAPANGDSGGPLVANVAGSDKIIGVLSGGGDFYGDENYWTRTSSFSGFISDASAVLSSLGPISVSGSTASNPLLATVSNPSTDVTQQRFFTYAPDGYTYFNVDGRSIEDVVSSGLLIDALRLSSSISGEVHVWVWDAVLGAYVDTGSIISGGDIFSFGSAVDRFRLIGLGDEFSIIGLDFDQIGFTRVVWTGMDELVSAVPLPPSFALYGCGLIVLAGCSYRLNRKKTSVHA